MKRALALLAAVLAMWPATAFAGGIIGFIALGVAAVASIPLTGGASIAILLTASVALSFVSQAMLRPSSLQPSASTDTGSSSSASVAQRVTIDQKQDVRQATAPRQIIYGAARVGGVFGFFHEMDGNQVLLFTLLLAGHRCAQIVNVFFNDELLSIDENTRVVNGGTYKDNAAFWFHEGAPGQQADEFLLGRIPGIWDSTRRGENITYLVGNLHWDHDSGDGSAGSKLWTGGIPNITAIVRGKLCFDPRTGNTGHTHNAALCILDYLLDPVYGLGVDYATGINVESVIAAANACDELVLKAGDGGYEPRYEINGSFKSDAQPDEILGKMCGAMHGKAIYDGDRWTLIAGVYVPPEVIITDDMMVAASSIQTLTSARDSFTGVKGTYIDPNNGWNGADFPPVKSATYASIDGRERLRDIELPFTTSVTMAQRIAKIDLLRGRQEIVETFTGNLLCWQLSAGDTVYRTSARYGWFSKLFEVSKVRFVLREGGEGQAGTLAVELLLQELSPFVYDWNTDDETSIDPAPNTNFPDIFTVGTPGLISWEESLYVSREAGGAKAQLRVSWLAADDAFVVAYQLRYQRIDIPNQPLNIRPRVNGLVDTIPDIAPGSYALAVNAINWANVAGTTFSTATAVVYGLSAAPGTPQNLTLTTMGGFCFLRWDKSTDLDVLHGGSVVIRFSTSLANPLWAEGVLLSKPLPGDDTLAAVPARVGTYMVKFVDSSGIPSAEPARVAGFQNSVLDFVGLGEAVEDPAWAGTRTNVAIDAGNLVLVGPPGILIDDVPEIDALTSFDNYAAGFPPGTYLFANMIDLGTVTRCRLTSYIVSLVFMVNDLIDMRSQNIDDWPTIDDIATGDEANATLYVRWTNDNPAGSPTWSSWQRLDSAEFDNRAFQFKLELTRTEENVSILISGTGVVAEEVA